MSRSSGRRLAMGLTFIGPSILGFLAFTLIPLVISFAMAFTDWDLRRHNMFQNKHLLFVGLDNFRRLIAQPDFWKFLGNTLFFMMGVPFAIGGSLLLAIFLSKDFSGGSRRGRGILIGTAGVLLCAVVLVLCGAGSAAMTILLGTMVCGILLCGTVVGSTLYRTLLYLPSFTSGVAVFILWKKLYNPNNGPINQALTPLLTHVSHLVNSLPPSLVSGGLWLALLIAVVLVAMTLRWLRTNWIEGEIGTWSALLGLMVLLIPVAVCGYMGLGGHWLPGTHALAYALAVAALLAYQAVRLAGGRTLTCTASEGLGGALMLTAVVLTLQFILVGVGIAFHGLPVWAAASDGLQPPQWLADYYWAKPALMIMGFWGGIGSNNMLLYLAGLSNVPVELYEAADIDGASRFQKFWSVTWPQLAPTTFFIVVMSVIGGLQGGFETARTMTNGGPAGSTTTLSYFIYSEGFETGRLGYSSAVAWTLFLMVLLVTLFNWKFGSRYVND